MGLNVFLTVANYLLPSFSARRCGGGSERRKLKNVRFLSSGSGHCPVPTGCDVGDWKIWKFAAVHPNNYSGRWTSCLQKGKSMYGTLVLVMYSVID